MVTKWSLYWADLNPIRGSEQAGTRPVLVISNNMVNEVLPNVTVIPVSSMKQLTKIYPTEVFLSMEVTSLPKPSVAMIHQIRTISKERIGALCGVVHDEAIRQEIHRNMMQYFDLESTLP